jgi:pyrroline-5-carboxylate reductase
MQTSDLAHRGLVLLGCGKMGSAMLEGWLRDGLPSSSVWIVDPAPSEWVRDQNVHVNSALPVSPAVVIVAVKPQMMGNALPAISTFGNAETLFISVAAGTQLSSLAEVLGAKTPIVRAMPNTPAAVGKGITALIGNDNVSTAQLELADHLMSAVGEVVHLSTEAQMDAVTGVSGSGPAYVFHLIECLAAAAEAEGLPSGLALQLARATVAGAGALAMQSGEDPGQLRRNVTSPNGTTQAGLDVLMDGATGLPPLIQRTVAAATARSRELGIG